MTSRILKLDRHIYDKIAAGEVVERPASIVKELVENAIDAQATRITIEISKGGKERIRVVDNGTGIHPDDVVIAFDRHATSKIRSADDIYAIGTLGFRGEALSSIAAVSRCVLTTKTVETDQGVCLQVENGHASPIKSVGCPNGTSVEITELFYHTPARLKFLKSDLAEQTAITDLVSRLALSHPEISICYMVEQKQIFNTRGDGKNLSAIAAVHGVDVARQLLPVTFEMTSPQGTYTLTGQVSKITHTRGNRTTQLSYINGRFIKSELIAESIKLAYGHAIPIGRFPSVFLYFDIPKEAVDVNIHPAKTEVKFHEEGLIKQLIYEGVKSALIQIDQTNRPDIKPTQASRPAQPIAQTQSTASVQPTAPMQPAAPVHAPAPAQPAAPVQATAPAQPAESIEPTQPRQHVVPSSSAQHAGHQESSALINQIDKAELPTVEPVAPSMTLPKPDISPLKALELMEKMSHYSETEQVESMIETSNKPYEGLHYIGQIFQSYLLFERGQELCFIDQHAAHEKVMFEHLLSDYKQKKIHSQMLLLPYTLQLDVSDYDRTLASINFFSDLGIVVEDYGHKTIIVREVPILFNEPAPIQFIEEIIEELSHFDLNSFERGNHPYEKTVTHIILESCKSAIKANQSLTPQEVASLLNQLSNLDEPYTCPHGRPILISLSRDKIGKLFYR